MHYTRTESSVVTDKQMPSSFHVIHKYDVKNKIKKTSIHIKTGSNSIVEWVNHHGHHPAVTTIITDIMKYNFQKATQKTNKMKRIKLKRQYTHHDRQQLNCRMD